MSVRRGSLTRWRTRLCTSGIDSVNRRKHLTVARTTALLAWRNRSSSKFIMVKISSSDSGSYFASKSRTEHWPHSLKSRIRFSRWMIMALFTTIPPSSKRISFNVFKQFTITYPKRTITIITINSIVQVCFFLLSFPLLFKLFDSGNGSIKV